MTFHDRLKRKLDIDALATKVAHSLRGPDSGVNFDRRAMQTLLEMGPYRHERERETDLYILETGPGKGTILVLDNGLPIYRTTKEDVLMRKSPTVKEMVSFSNAFKILNDRDVRVSKKVDSLKTVRQRTLEHLDLNYDAEDIGLLAAEGRQALVVEASDRVEEILALFGELLDLTHSLPKAFRSATADTMTMGRILSHSGGDYTAGPVILYDGAANVLGLVKGPLDTQNRRDMETYQQIFTNTRKADKTGPAVFDHLRQLVLTEKPSVSTDWERLGG